MQSSYDSNVFINCPFDSSYSSLFEALTFAVYDCGFLPRCALEVDDSSQVRIEKITGIIKQSCLAIHDVSRTQLDRTTRLPRFNMPLELGIFLGAKAFGSGGQKRKVAIVLDTEPYRYHKYISDIAGQDIRAHHGRAEQAIKVVRNFLASHKPADVLLPGGEVIVQRFRRFRDELPQACVDLGLEPSELTFGDLTRLIRGWMNANPLRDGDAVLQLAIRP